MINPKAPRSKPAAPQVNAETIQIMKALGYDQKEIAANIKGKMTQRQRAAFHKDLSGAAIKGGIGLIVVVMLGVLLVAGVFDPVLEYLLQYRSESRQDRSMLLLWVALGMGALFALSILYKVTMAYLALRRGVILRYEGQVKKETTNQRGMTSHKLYFDGLKRDVPPKIYDLFRTDKRYVIYHLKDYPSFLTIQVLD